MYITDVNRWSIALGNLELILFGLAVFIVVFMVAGVIERVIDKVKELVIK